MLREVATSQLSLSPTTRLRRLQLRGKRQQGHLLAEPLAVEITIPGEESWIGGFAPTQRLTKRLYRAPSEPPPRRRTPSAVYGACVLGDRFSATLLI
jgi:hypothetical protein